MCVYTPWSVRHFVNYHFLKHQFEGGINPLIMFGYFNTNPVSKNYLGFLAALWLSLRPYVLRMFILNAFRRIVLRYLECKPSLSAWPRQTLLTSRITQPHAVPRVRHSSLTANHHNIYILHLRHIKKDLQTQHGGLGRAGLSVWERKYSSWERKTILSRLVIIQKEGECHDIIKLAWWKCMESLLQVRMLWLSYRAYFYKAHTVLLAV